MIGFIKDLAHAMLPLALYVSAWGAVALALAGRTHPALALVLIFSPIPNLWYLIHPLPYGKDTLDALLVACLVGMAVKKQLSATSRNGAFIVFYLLMIYLSVWIATLRFRLPMPLSAANPAFVFYKQYFQMILLYFVAFHALRDAKTQRLALLFMMLMLFLVVLREARQFSVPSAGYAEDSRAGGPFWIVGLGANHFAAFVVHYGSVGLAMAFYERQKLIRWGLYLTTWLSLKSIMFAFSRGAYLATAMVLLVMGALKKRLLIGLLIALGIAWTTLLPSSVVERITMTESSTGQLESSAATRVVLWKAAFGLFEQSPVVGVGYKGFEFSRAGGYFTSVHNLYLETLAEQGVVGILLLLAIMVRALFTGIRLFFGGRDDLQKSLGLGFMCCVLATMLTNLFGDRWSYLHIGAYYWAFWGIADRMLVNNAAVKKAEATG